MNADMKNGFGREHHGRRFDHSIDRVTSYPKMCIYGESSTRALYTVL